MITDKVISISDLRTNATKIINDLPKSNEKYIFVHNKPKAVLIDIDLYEKMMKDYEFPSIEDIQSYKESSHWKDWVEAFTFLDSLMKDKNV